jgi:hypothetical protein
MNCDVQTIEFIFGINQRAPFFGEAAIIEMNDADLTDACEIGIRGFDIEGDEVHCTDTAVIA